MPVVVPELADRCVVLNGVAKTYAMTGWRVGWMIGPADVIKAATNLQSHLTSNVCNVAQRAALAAVTGSLDAVAEMRDRVRPAAPDDRRAAGARSRASSARPRRARSTPTRRCSALLGQGAARGAAATSAELAAAVLEHAEVAVVPGEAFGTPGYFRLSYALGDDDLAHRRAADGRPAGRGPLTPRECCAVLEHGAALTGAAARPRRWPCRGRSCRRTWR